MLSIRSSVDQMKINAIRLNFPSFYLLTMLIPLRLLAPAPTREPAMAEGFEIGSFRSFRTQVSRGRSERVIFNGFKILLFIVTLAAQLIFLGFNQLIFRVSSTYFLLLHRIYT